MRETIVPIVVDTADDASVRDAVARALDGLGGLDILVNNAATPGGQAPPPRLADVTTEDFFADVNVKVLGYLRCAREVAPVMIAQRWGRIINVSGLAARQTGAIVGSIRNVAVAALTKNLADELGGYGINVTVVHPGLTRTEKTAAVVAARAEARGIRHGPGRGTNGSARGHRADRGRSRGRRRHRLPRLATQRGDHRRRHRGRWRNDRGHPLLTSLGPPPQGRTNV